MRRRGYRSQPVIDLTAEVPGLEPLSPLGGPLTPEPRPRYHSDECFCSTCADIRAAMNNYIEAKRLFDKNGFN